MIYCQIKLNNNAIFTHPSGTGTFFWALGATGLSSPANRALTSSATSTSFCCSFWMYFTSCRMQEAWEQNRQKSGSTSFKVCVCVYIYKFSTILKGILPSLGPPGWHSGQRVVICLSSAGWFPVLLCSLCFPPGSSAQWQIVWLHSAHTLPGCGLVVWPPWDATSPPASALGSPGVYKEVVWLQNEFVQISADITFTRLLISIRTARFPMS